MYKKKKIFIGRILAKENLYNFGYTKRHTILSLPEIQ